MSFRARTYTEIEGAILRTRDAMMDAFPQNPDVIRMLECLAGEIKHLHWQPMDTYPDKGRRDEDGKWIDEAGPMVDLLMPDDSVVTARWYGARTAGGGEAWGWWEEGSSQARGLYEPKAWRMHSDFESRPR